jgi:hypothetical protein
MKRLSDLGFLFMVVAMLELCYGLVGLVPPAQIGSITGWELSPDGQWIAKLLAIALLSQAWVAWTLRTEPHLGVARGLAFYQLASATADWVMWIWLADEGIFSGGTVIVVAAIVTHYLLGFLLVLAIRGASVRTANAPDAPRPAPAGAG